MDVSNFLDFFDLWFNEIVGDTTLGFMLGLLLILGVGIKLKINNKVILLLAGLWALLVSVELSLWAVYTMLILIIGTMSYKAILKIVRD